MTKPVFPLYIREEALRLCNEMFKEMYPNYTHVEWCLDSIGNTSAALALCKVLMNGCEPLPVPLDPDLLLAREICAAADTSEHQYWFTACLAGKSDQSASLQQTLKYIKTHGVKKVT